MDLIFQCGFVYAVGMRYFILGSFFTVFTLLSLSAHAEDKGVDLSLGGFYNGYLTQTNQDHAPNAKARSTDWQQNTEIHFNGESALDNGLTVGYHAEVEADADDSFDVQESYAYFSGDWGRVNAGAEDGAAYLMQVAAPSADNNIDGLRQYINPVNYAVIGGRVSTLNSLSAIQAGTNLNVFAADGGGDDIVVSNAFTGATSYNAGVTAGYDYDHAITGWANKLTYITPKISGAQAAISYVPENDDDNRNLEGVRADNESGDFGSAYEVALRYEGELQKLSYQMGAGLAFNALEAQQNISFIDANNDNLLSAGEQILARRDDRTVWNLGFDSEYGPFGFGTSYQEDNLGIDQGAKSKTTVVGADYKTGYLKVGTSYYKNAQDISAYYGKNAGNLDTDRYSGGLTYTYGPGMSFRGSLNYTEHTMQAQSKKDATSLLLGTQINF
jgi:predicted porin